MISMTATEIADAVGGSLIGSGDIKVSCVDTDSRSIREGSLFIPLIGERFDGHDYIETALRLGAAAVLTARRPEGTRTDKAYIMVEDTRLAMKALAIHYREKFDIPVVGVVGSVGKTTAKDMIAAVLSQKFNVLKTEQNLNNDFGVPQMIFKLEKEHRAAVLEMGMNHFGEIRYLAEMVRPDYVVMTNIGDAHIENLGSRENILKAKSEVFEFFSENGVAVLNGDDVLLAPLADTLPQLTLLCGESEGCDPRAVDIDLSDDDSIRFKTELGGEETEIRVPSAGKHMIYPALFAAALGELFGLSRSDICRGIESFSPSKMRMNIKRLDEGIVVLDDAYNANPQSMQAGIETLAVRNAKKRIAVLGDMLELGQLGEQAHRLIGKVCADCGIDLVITQGELAKYISYGASKGNGKVRHCDDKQQLCKLLQEEIKPGTAVLVKASRGMHFEEVTAFIEEKFGKN